MAAGVVPRLVSVISEVNSDPAVRPRELSTMGTNRRFPMPVVTVKTSALMAVPPTVSTLIGPLAASGGTMTSRLVVERTSTSRALTSLKPTSTSPRKSVPVRVTAVPTGPRTGVNRVTVGSGAAGVVASAWLEKPEESASLKACTR